MSENVREPQVLDTIGKGGNYWRIVEIDENGSVTAWRIYDGKIYKKGRPLRINVEKIKDGTFRLLDIPPVTIIKQEPINPEWGKEILPPEEEAEEEPEKEPEPHATLLTEDIQDVRLRLEDRIEELEIGLDKALKELESAERDRDMMKVSLRIAEQEKAKAEGQVTGLMAAMNLLIYGQGAKR